LKFCLKTCVAMKFVDDDDDDDIKYYTLVFCLSLNCTVMQLKKSEQN